MRMLTSPSKHKERHMSYSTKSAAIASLREFAPWLRQAHTIVRFWSATHNAWRYSRILNAR